MTAHFTIYIAILIFMYFMS